LELNGEGFAMDGDRRTALTIVLGIALSALGYPDPICAYKRFIAEYNKASGGNDYVVKVSVKDNCGALAISVERNACLFVQGRGQVAPLQPPWSNAKRAVPAIAPFTRISAPATPGPLHSL
jgi:hypothetical protein